MITANFKPAKLKKEGPNFFKDFETQVKWIGNRILWLKYFLDRKWMETEQWYSEYNRGGPLDISMKEQCKTWLLGLDGCLILWYWGSFYEPTTCFFGGEPFLQQNQYNKQKQQNAKKKHSMNNEQFCVALFFPPLFSKRSCFPPFLHPGRWTPHPFRKEKWSEPNLHEDMCKMWIFQGCIFSLFPTFRPFLVLKRAKEHQAILFSARLRLPASHLSMLEEPTDLRGHTQPSGLGQPFPSKLPGKP